MVVTVVEYEEAPFTAEYVGYISYRTVGAKELAEQSAKIKCSKSTDMNKSRELR